MTSTSFITSGGSPSDGPLLSLLISRYDEWLSHDRLVEINETTLAEKKQLEDTVKARRKKHDCMLHFSRRIFQIFQPALVDLTT